MNAYDFDGTIYDGDSTRDFFFHCLRRYPGLWRFALSLIAPAVRLALRRDDLTGFKRAFFRFLRFVPNAEAEVSAFWARKSAKIKPFYIAQRRPDDLILSASPEFLLRPALAELGVSGLIATRVELPSGELVGLNCKGEEKLRRLRAQVPGARIDAFYSDSLSDAPLARIAKAAYLVAGDRIAAWPRG